MRERKLGLAAALVLAVAALLALPATAFGATAEGVIDFEGLAAGTVVSSLSSGAGISGDPIAGSVGVFGDSANPGITTNAAIVFDSACGGSAATCSGGDADLFKPALGKTLIMAEDLVDANSDSLIDDPDDADLRNAPFTFDFSGFGPGSVTVASIDVMDIEASVEQPAFAELFGAGMVLLGTVNLPSTGNNGLATVPIGVADVVVMRVTFQGSGAIDNIRISIEEPPPPPPPGGNEGCTPGFWKNHASAWGPTGYSMSDSYNAVFGVSWAGGVTLGDAIGANGGGFNALARHSVAALLNAAHPDIDYPMTSSQIIAAVQAAYASGDAEPTKDQLDANNNLGCSIDR